MEGAMAHNLEGAAGVEEGETVGEEVDLDLDLVLQRRAGGGPRSLRRATVRK